MSRTRVGFLLAGAALIGGSQARAQGLTEAPATLVAVSVQVDGRQASLYPAPDGSGRYYLEARTGSRYAVALANRTGERVGVVLTVDGLNAISGEQDKGRGRMYVLDPWQSTSVQGWRSSLQEVRQFTFVDERRLVRHPLGKGQREDGLDRGRGLPRAPRSRAGDTVPLLRAAARKPYPADEQAKRERDQAPAAPEASSAKDDGDAGARVESDAELRSYPAGPAGPAHARSGRAGELDRRGGAARVHRAALRVPPGPRRMACSVPADESARPPVAARARRARLSRPAW